jgi:hypothetical protein
MTNYFPTIFIDFIEIRVNIVQFGCNHCSFQNKINRIVPDDTIKRILLKIVEFLIYLPRI